MFCTVVKRMSNRSCGVTCVETKCLCKQTNMPVRKPVDAKITGTVNDRNPVTAMRRCWETKREIICCVDCKCERTTSFTGQERWGIERRILKERYYFFVKTTNTVVNDGFAHPVRVCQRNKYRCITNNSYLNRLMMRSRLP